MRKTSFVTFLSVWVLVGLLMSCGGSKTPPVSERIAKIWTARIVEENTSTVYTRGGTTNIRPTYSNFKLDLSSPPTVKLTEFDGNTFVGQYSLPTDQQVTLTALQPAPTGTNGTITFTINSLSDTELVLIRTTTSQKTGGTTNKYTLSNP